MKFSVLMPTFRRKSYLRDAVMALKRQTHEDWELIIKEGGEGEGHSVISDLIAEDNRITYIHNKDRGITDAMNQAMRIATGDIFVWANDDDLIKDDAMETVAKEIGEYHWGYGKIQMTRDGRQEGEMGYPVTIDDMRSGNKIPQPAVYWTRKAFEAVGYMSERQDLVSDYDYWCRLLKAFPEYKFINKHLAEYRLHEDQITSKILQEQSQQALEVRRSI